MRREQSDARESHALHAAAARVERRERDRSVLQQVRLYAVEKLGVACGLGTSRCVLGITNTLCFNYCLLVRTSYYDCQLQNR